MVLPEKKKSLPAMDRLGSSQSQVMADGKKIGSEKIEGLRENHPRRGHRPRGPFRDTSAPMSSSSWQVLFQ